MNMKKCSFNFNRLLTAYLYLISVTALYFLIMSIGLALSGEISLSELTTESGKLLIIAMIAFGGILASFFSVLVDDIDEIIQKRKISGMILNILSLLFSITAVILYIPFFPAFIYVEVLHGYTNFGPLVFSNFSFWGLILIILFGLCMLSSTTLNIIIPTLKKLSQSRKKPLRV